MRRSARPTRRDAVRRGHTSTPARSLFGFPLPVAVGLLIALGLLLAHAARYAFLTDDSFISFRYARNLAGGYGLVFNPGFERVEGYTNFLWVLLLAGFDALGLAPERVANPLSLLATVALWVVVVRFVRRRVEPGFEWLALVPAFALALTRTFAVWSTSGLETRLFELLAISGLLRLVHEVEAEAAGRAVRPAACLLLALATWTRPDGLLMAACGFGIAGGYLALERRERLRPWLLRQWPFVAMVVAQFAFRRLYYGDWLPNTYYAKVGGKTWWDSGRRYLLAFVLEYGVLAWLPLLVGAVVWNVRRRTPLLPLMAFGVIVPHTLYLAAIGGDHFEYRPLGVAVVLAFILFADGVRALIGSPARKVGTAALLAVVVLGLVTIPWESHRQFITTYRPGFPGVDVESGAEAQAYLSLDRDPLLRLPLLRRLARKHRDLTRWLTYHFVAVRQEEHKMFLATAIAEARGLERLRSRGVIPQDTYIAVDCVGAIPYYSRLRTLDRLGLTDAHVAHSKPVREVMAHSKSATMEYARERGVDLWSVDAVHLIQPLTSMRMMVAVQDGFMTGQPHYAVDVGPDGYLICDLPMGLERTRRHFGTTPVLSFADSSFLKNYLARTRAAWTDSLIADPYNLHAARNLGYILMLAQDYPAAEYHYQVMTQAYPDLVEGFELLSIADFALGRGPEGLAAADSAIVLAGRHGDQEAIHRIRERLAGQKMAK